MELLQQNFQVFKKSMDNVEGMGDKRTPSAAMPPRKDRATLPEPPSPPDALTTCTEPNCSLDVLQAATSTSLPVHKYDGRDRHLTVNGTNELSEKLAESLNSCVVERAFVESSMVPADEYEGNGWEKTMAGEFSTHSAISAVEEHEPSEAYRLAGIAASHRRIGLRGVESSDKFTSDQSLANGVHGGTGPFKYGANSITPYGSRQLQAVGYHDAAKSEVVGNAAGGMVPSCGTLASINGGKPTSAGVPAGSRGSSHELAVGEVEFPSKTLVRIDSHTRARVEGQLGTDLHEEVKRNLDMVCPENTRCGLKALKLRRQRDKACERAQCLEKQIHLLRELYAADFEFLLKMVGNVKEKNRWLSVVNREQRRHIQEQLSRQSHSTLSDVLRTQMVLQLEADRLRQGLLRKEEQLQALIVTCQYFRTASQENYRTAIEKIKKMDRMLQLAIHTLEEEVGVVSGCPGLMQLLRSLCGGGGTGEETNE